MKNEMNGGNEKREKHTCVCTCVRVCERVKVRRGWKKRWRSYSCRGICYDERRETERKEMSKKVRSNNKRKNEGAREKKDDKLVGLHARQLPLG